MGECLGYGPTLAAAWLGIRCQGWEGNDIRKRLILTVKLLVTVGLLLALASRVDLARVGVLIEHAARLPLVLAAVALTATIPVNAVRWHLILATGGASPGPRSLLKILLVGLFFNQVLPSGIGGDAVRAWRCHKLGVGLAAAIRSILLERVSGLLVFAFLYAISMPVLLRLIQGGVERRALVLVLAAAIAGMLSLLAIDQLPRSIVQLRIVAPFATLSREARALFFSPRLSATLLALSFVGVALTIFAFQLVGDSLGQSLSYSLWMVVVPPVALIQVLPISFAGWGVRETGLVVILAAYGVPPESALAISLSFGLLQILIGLPGGLVWLAGWDISSMAAQEQPVTRD
jgi:glycosyltransferase 2 family protein